MGSDYVGVLEIVEEVKQTEEKEEESKGQEVPVIVIESEDELRITGKMVKKLLWVILNGKTENKVAQELLEKVSEAKTTVCGYL